MKRTVGFVFLFSTLLLAFAPGAQADNTVCTGAIVIVPDGSPHEGAFLGQDRFFRFVAKANRSYAVMVDNLSPTDVQSNILISAPFVTCPNVGPLPVTTTPHTEPVSLTDDISGSQRFSMVATTNTDAFFALFGSAGNFGVRVEETTLFNPAWSTFGTFETFYSCVNTTNDGTLDATLTLFNTAGVQVGMPFNFTDVPARGTVSTNTGTLSVANNLNGSATLTHNGPPGAFTCEAAIANFAVTPNIIQPVKFEPARQMR